MTTGETPTPNPDTPTPSTAKPDTTAEKQSKKIDKLTNWSLRRGIRSEPIIAEPNWARNIASIHPGILNFAIAVLSALTGVAFGNKNWIAGILLIIFIGTCFGLDTLRDHRDIALEKERDEIQKDAVHSIMHALTDCTQGIGDALHIQGKQQRDKQIAAARRAIMSTVGQRIGPPEGVRANLFEVCNTSPTMLKASTFVHDGRQNHHSKRTFTMDDESLIVAVENNQGRYVYDTTDLIDENGNPLEYGCFAVMPVSTGERLFGLLTVDSQNPYDIDRFHGGVLLNHFASLLCLTYVRDDGAKSVPVGTSRDVAHRRADADANGDGDGDGDGKSGLEATRVEAHHPEAPEQREGCTDDQQEG